MTDDQRMEYLERQCGDPPDPLSDEVEYLSEAHAEHPTGGFCIWCREQWPCRGLIASRRDVEREPAGLRGRIRELEQKLRAQIELRLRAEAEESKWRNYAKLAGDRLAEERKQTGHTKHPSGDYCAYCLGQWPCEGEMLAMLRRGGSQ